MRPGDENLCTAEHVGADGGYDNGDGDDDDS